MIRRTFAGIAAALSFALVANAQDFPTRTVRAIVPVPPGGVIDNTMRVVVDRLGARLGQPVVIENRPGANGTIGAQIVAKAAPDGHTFLAAVEGTMLVSMNPGLSPQSPVHTLRDLAPITKLGDYGLALVAHPSVKAANLAAFIAIAKTSGAPYAYGTSGIGSSTHLTAELLAQRSGVNLVHVPYKGGGQAMTDVLGGQIPLAMTTVPTAQQHVKAGKIIGLGTPSPRRAQAIPDMPTFIESGLAGFEVTGWVGLFAPAKTPKAIIDRLQKELAAVLADAEVRAQYATLGMEGSGIPADEFAQEVRTLSERWIDVVTRGKIKLE